ncbi:MAG: hypothetical protein GXP49_11385 [Deltaproteobacteria bacterium]|nr:hypothetical protein [Deltaproteobacteria bacterium]
MILLNLAIEPGAGMSGGITQSFSHGYNLFRGDQAKTNIIAAALAAALYPDSQVHASLEARGKSRVLFKSRAGWFGIVERDLSLDTATLFKSKSPNGPFSPIGGNSTEIGQHFRINEKLPPVKAFLKVYMGLFEETQKAESSPIEQNMVVSGVGVSKVMSLPSFEQISPIQHLLDLRKELHASQRAEDIEYELEGIRQELFRLEDRHRKYIDSQQALKELKQQLAELPVVSRGSVDLDQRLEEVASEKKALKKELKRLTESYKQRSASSRSRSFKDAFKDPLALVGLTIGLFLLLLAIIIGKGARFLALGSIASLGVTAYSFWKFVDEEEKKESERKRLHVIKDRCNNLQDRLNLLKKEEQRLMNTHDGLDPVERSRIIEERKKLSARHDDLEARLSSVRNSQIFRHFEQRRIELQRSQETLEEELGKLSAISATQGALRDEVARLEKKLNLRPGEPIPPDLTVPDSFYDEHVSGQPKEFKFSADSAVENKADYFKQIFSSAGEDMFFREPEEIAQEVSHRLEQILPALTGGVVNGIRFGTFGSIASIITAGGEQKLEQIQKHHLWACINAIRFSLAESAREKFQVPILFGPETDESEDFTMASEALRILGQKLQVIHYSTRLSQ